jgi:hypothetical protein
MSLLHQWTNGGDRVMIVRFVDEKNQSYGGFQWPTEIGSVVTCPDWDAKAECGNGLHGWPWGIGIGEGKEPVYVNANWQVVSADPKDIVWLDGKVKCREVQLEYVGSWWKALEIIEKGRDAWIQRAARGAASATGKCGAASATGASGAASATGESGAASATGARGAASATGARGAASATGWRGAASATGARGAASATGWRGAASATGECGAASATCCAAVTGLYGKARAAEFGCIALAWWNKKKQRVEMRCSLVGKKRGQLKPDTWYRLDEATGEFVEA